jgi:glycerol-1-phosphatase
MCEHRRMVPDALHAAFDCLLLDLDGVVYVGSRPVPHAVATINSLTAAGVSLCYVTNNASRTPESVAEKLRRLGLTTTRDDVVTSAQAGAALLTTWVAAGETVLAVGGPGVGAALREAGFAVIDAMTDPETDERDPVAGVLQGFGRDLGWQQLARASFAVAGGVPWVATNTDMTIPVAGGIAPGNGTLVAAVSAATGRRPEVAGKPFPPLLERAARLTNGTSPLVVGDRLDTDIEGARNAGMASALVLTGVTRTLDLWRAAPERRPDHLMGDLRDLVAAPRPVTVSEGAVTCAGSAAAVKNGGGLIVSTDDDPVAAIWAAAHVLWRTQGQPANAGEVAAGLDRALAERNAGS